MCEYRRWARFKTQVDRKGILFNEIERVVVTFFFRQFWDIVIRVIFKMTESKAIEKCFVLFKHFEPLF